MSEIIKKYDPRDPAKKLYDDLYKPEPQPGYY